MTVCVGELLMKVMMCVGVELVIMVLGEELVVMICVMVEEVQMVLVVMVMMCVRVGVGDNGAWGEAGGDGA